MNGGSSLQEMMVPVVKVISAKGKQNVGFVNVEISSFISRITNSVFKIDFMQMEPVTDKVKPRKLLSLPMLMGRRFLLMFRLLQISEKKMQVRD